MAIDLVRLSFLQWLEAEDATVWEKRAMFREYYEGKHQAQLTSRQRKFLEMTAEQEFNVNYCPLVVDALAERLKVTGFECEGQAEQMWEWWQRNRMDATQGVAHTAAVRDGDTFLIVEWDNAGGFPRITQENAYDGSEGVHVVYSTERRSDPIVAIKKWLIESGPGAGDTRRANLYYPDRIEKYTASITSDWQLLSEEPWSVGGMPLGIPVVHFRNKDQGYTIGESELEDVVPLVNWGNKTALDLAAAADTSAFRIPWMTGGKPENMSMGIGSWAYTTSKEATIGELAPADLGGLINLANHIAADIARITRTPLAYFQMSGQVAAEGTLKQQESGLVGKVRDRQVVFGNSWEDALAMARKLYNAFGPGGMDESQNISCLWADPETRNEVEHLTGLEAKARLGVPQETIWSEMGYGADQIAKMQEQAAVEKAAGIASLGQALLRQERSFNGGPSA
jgi:hypothetical protein